MPREYVTDLLARRYHCAPVEVEQWPPYHRTLALQLWDLEAECEPTTPPPARR